MAGDERGVQGHLKDCRALCERQGWIVVGEHVDNDISAYSAARRPAYGSLLDAIRSGSVDVVVVWHTDRLYRRMKDLEEYITVCQPRNVPTHAVQMGPLDLTTPSGRMVARQLAAVAQYESEHKGERQKRANRQAAQEGKYFGTVRPFGYSDDGLSLVPDEARAIRDAYQLILDGGSVYEVTRRWNAAGLITPKGNRWGAPGVGRVLRYARHAAMRTYHGEVVTDADGEPVTAEWPAIVDRDAWHAAQAILRDPARLVRSAFSSDLLLSGIATCAVCGNPIQSGGRKDGKARYRCGGGHVYRQADPVDALLRRLIVERLAQVPHPQVEDDPSVTAAVRDEIATLNQRMDGLAEAYADGALTLSQLQRGTERLRGLLQAAEARIPSTPTGGLSKVLTASPEAVAETFDALTLKARREVVRALVTVKLKGAGHPSRATITEDGVVYARPDSLVVDWIRQA